MGHREHRDLSFFKWSVVGLMLAFGAVAILSIGGPLFLLGLVLLGVMLARGPRWPSGLGTLAGIGIVGLVIGAIGAVAEPGIWVVSGSGLIAVGAGAFWWLRGRPIHPPGARTPTA